MCGRGNGRAAAGRVVSVNISDRKHVAKKPVPEAELKPGVGIPGDAHAGPGDRQVSLLALEAIERMRQILSDATRQGLDVKCPKGGDALGPGSFAENLTVAGIDLPALPIGTRLRIGKEAIIEVTRTGKECHRRCAIYDAIGECIMPGEGVFARVLAGGIVRPGDEVRIERGDGARCKPWSAAILVVSDRSSRGEREDISGPALARAVEAAGFRVVRREIVPDERPAIEDALRSMADSGSVHLLLTSGGTGVGPRDVTPEATLAVIERRVPGLAEAMRARSIGKTPHAMLSRAEAGIRGRCLIVNLPGSPKGAVECFETIAPALGHAMELLAGMDPDNRPAGS
ncbi:MAG: molybdopterin-binding protein [Planctomycetota bacterium]|nr:molybdopterin-binding protein [Planctomycetota bacterium]